MDLISVIVPVYNKETTLDQCLSSLLGQQLSLSAESEINLQLIVIDDGSTDSSLQVAQKYAQQDKRILLLHQYNQGVGAARENGLNHVTGSYIAFCPPLARQLFNKLA